MQSDKKLTVVFLLYNAQTTVARLLQCALKQVHPDFGVQSDWVDFHFNDDCSKDQTETFFQDAFRASSCPQNVKYFRAEQNRGLAGSINASMKRIESPYVLTCHVDAFFSESDYLYKMICAMDENPKLGAITGRPVLPTAEMSFLEKVTTTFNLMDVLQPLKNNTKEISIIGFAEGRCDIFRVSALQKTGFYDQSFRVAGEDLALAGKLREAGYEIAQHNSAKYELTLSSEQDSITKLVKHTFLFGRVAPRIFSRSRLAVKSVMGETAGSNRRSRSFLRGMHLLTTVALPVTVFGLTVGILIPMPKVLTFVCVYEGIFLAIKTALFFRHTRAVRLNLLIFFILLPLHRILDLSYSIGIIRGFMELFDEPTGN